MSLSMCLVIEIELSTQLKSSNVKNNTFKIITITVTEIPLIQVLFFTFTNNSSLSILVDVHFLHENGEWILRVSNGAKWLNVFWKWLWNIFPLQLTYIQAIT